MVSTVNIVTITSTIVPLISVSMVVLVLIWCQISIVNVRLDIMVAGVRRISMIAFQCLVYQVSYNIIRSTALMKMICLLAWKLNIALHLRLFFILINTVVCSVSVNGRYIEMGRIEIV